MRIVFIGAVEFSYRALEKLIAQGAEIVGVFTQADAGINADFRDMGELCETNGIPLWRGQDVNSREALDRITALSPEIVFCFGWSRLLKRELLEIAPKGVVGFHPSALPQNRGRHPLIWALALGLENTATTFFFMAEGADTGDVISQRPISIDPNDDAATLYEKVTKVALEQLTELLPELKAGTVKRFKQDERLGNVWRKRSAPDGKIDWRMSAQSIHNLVRALTKPYVGAHFVRNGEMVRLWKCKFVPYSARNQEPGKVIETDQAVCMVKCGEGALLLLETEPPIELKPGEYL
jgi:methionyl-tRNA formyltransferase